MIETSIYTYQYLHAGQVIRHSRNTGCNYTDARHTYRCSFTDNFKGWFWNVKSFAKSSYRSWKKQFKFLKLMSRPKNLHRYEFWSRITPNAARSGRLNFTQLRWRSSSDYVKIQKNPYIYMLRPNVISWPLISQSVLFFISKHLSHWVKSLIYGQSGNK